MAYTLTDAQEAALTSERDNLQETLDTYDSATFIASVNAGIASATELDDATLAVWTSTVQSTDGSQPRETVLSQLDGITPNRSVIFEDMNDDEPLYDMGAIQPVISDLTDAAIADSRDVESSRRIRLTLNRYYPDVDDKDTKPDSDSRNVFPDHPWFAYAPGIGTQTDYQDLNTLFQAGVFGNGGRGTPASIFDNGPDPAGITPGAEATGTNAQTSRISIGTVGGSSINVFIGDNERFFIYMGNFLNTSNSGPTLPGSSSTTGVSNLSIRGEVTAGTCTITNSVTGISTGITRAFEVGDVLSLNGGQVLVIAVTGTGMEMCTTPTPPSTSRMCTRTTSIRYLSVNSGTPTAGTVTSSNQNPTGSATKRTAYLNLKRFTTAIIAGATNIATPAINTQQEVQDEIDTITAQLGTQTSLIYQAKYNISNTRCNWNNGTLSALISRENSRLNLFNPQQLVDDGLIPSINDLVNEYTRTRDKIEEIQAILDGAS